MKLYNDISELVGGTPLLRLAGFERAYGLNCRILGKLEYLNPSGSVKDRIALAMISDAEERGELTAGTVIIEPTSGNTGIGLAAVGAARGYEVVLTMPETMSAERRMLLAAYGARIVLTEGKRGMRGAIEKAHELAGEYPKSFIPGQFVNPANPAVHYRTTGPELWRDSGGEIDVLVAGVGSGGTISGAGRFLREQNPGIRIFAVEPAASPVLSGGEAGAHGLQGIGAGFVPDTLDCAVYDEVITVGEDEAYDAARDVARSDGILVGISSGAALWAAAGIARREEYAGRAFAVVLPDTGDRYLSTPLFGGDVGN